MGSTCVALAGNASTSPERGPKAEPSGPTSTCYVFLPGLLFLLYVPAAWAEMLPCHCELYVTLYPGKIPACLALPYPQSGEEI